MDCKFAMNIKVPDLKGSTSKDLDLLRLKQTNTYDLTQPIHCTNQYKKCNNIAGGTLHVPYLSNLVTNGPQSSTSALETPSQHYQEVAVTAAPDTLFHNPGHLILDVMHHVNSAPFSPVQVTAVDGSICTFSTSNSVPVPFVIASQAGPNEGSAGPSRIDSQRISHNTPIILNFSPTSAFGAHGSASSSYNLGTTQLEAAVSSTRRSRARGVRRAAKRRIYTEPPHMMDANTLPVHRPLAPPQREGAPSDYMCFGRCDKFLNDNNGLVRLFRTARDKLLEADIPNFQIRLFGVVWSSQYELPTADTIGAIVYEGGPESMTDYDVVIEKHSREPESVNKLHPSYMSLQFPLLFIYGEDEYHLILTL
ncbi:hypothetical protein CTI12_AA623350 [Artemisia annua]|uniref:Helitron helicase-like domain-containing protein n=1 Tax=Artemisia annua TaxID=35608 RepID=A0A2U1KB62_ARTAN|nr:hypothetical protein CTI12_AA623350 [Artemisia annua]